MLLDLLKGKQLYVLVGDAHRFLRRHPAEIQHAVLRHQHLDPLLLPRPRIFIPLRKIERIIFKIPLVAIRFGSLRRGHIGQQVSLAMHLVRIRLDSPCPDDGAHAHLIRHPQRRDDLVAHGDGLFLRDPDVLQRVRRFPRRRLPLHHPVLIMGHDAAKPPDPAKRTGAIYVSAAPVRQAQHPLRERKRHRLRRQGDERILRGRFRKQLLQARNLLLLSFVRRPYLLARLRVDLHEHALHRVLQVRQHLGVAVLVLPQLDALAKQRRIVVHGLLLVERALLDQQHGVVFIVRHLDACVDAHGLIPRGERLHPALRRFVPVRRGGGRGHGRLHRPVPLVHNHVLLRRRLARRERRQHGEQGAQDAQRSFHGCSFLYALNVTGPTLMVGRRRGLRRLPARLLGGNKHSHEFSRGRHLVRLHAIFFVVSIIHFEFYCICYAALGIWFKSRSSLQLCFLL